MQPALYRHEANRHRGLARRSAPILLLLMANLLAACGGGGGGSVSTTAAVSPATAAPTAASLTCVGDTNLSGASVTLAWDAVPVANGYRVYYGTAPGTYDQLVGQGLDVGGCTTYTLTGLGSGTIYYFTVTAYNNLNEESGYSNEVSKQML